MDRQSLVSNFTGSTALYVRLHPTQIDRLLNRHVSLFVSLLLVSFSTLSSASPEKCELVSRKIVCFFLDDTERVSLFIVNIRPLLSDPKYFEELERFTGFKRNFTALTYLRFDKHSSKWDRQTLNPSLFSFPPKSNSPHGSVRARFFCRDTTNISFLPGKSKQLLLSTDF